MSGSKPAKTNQETEIATGHIMSGMHWCASRLWRWPVVGIGAPVLYGLGVTAMYANQYIVAATFYFAALAWLTTRAVAEARSHAEKGGVTFTIIAFGTLLFGGSLVWIKAAPTLPASQSSAPSATGWLAWSEWLSGGLAQCSVYIASLPWRWIVASLIIGALAVALIAWRLSFLRERKWHGREQELQGLSCTEPELHKRKADDKDRIKELVRIAGISYQPHFDRGSPHIDFVFSVFNISLYDIIIDNSIKKGAILFGGDFEKFFYEPKIEPAQPIVCRSRASSYFVIHQAVRAEEITRFRETDSILIAFDNLEIRFRTTEQPSATDTDTALEIKHYLETKKGIWRPLDQLAFVFGYTNEQWAELQERPKATAPETSEVKNELDIKKPIIDQLPPQVIRVKINLKGGSFAIEEHHHYDETLPLGTVGSQMVIARFRYMPDAGDETSIRVRGCVTYKNHGNSIESKTVWRGYGRETKTFHAGDRNDLILACTLPTEDGPTALCRFAYKVSLDPDGGFRDVVPQITALPGSFFLVTVELILSRGDVVVSTPSFSFNLNMEENVGVPEIAVAE